MKILEKIKNVFSDNEDNALFEKTLLDAYKETKNSFLSIKETDVYQKIISQWVDKQRVVFIVFLIKKIELLRKHDRSKYDGSMFMLCSDYVDYLLKTKIDLDEDDVVNIYHAFAVSDKYSYVNNGKSPITYWPIGYFLIRVESMFGKNPLPKLVEDTLNKLKKRLKTDNIYDEKHKVKLIRKVDELLNTDKNEVIQKKSFLGDDELKTFVDETIAALPNNEKTLWLYEMLKA